MSDDELSAVPTIVEVLKPLDEASRSRVLQHTAGRYEVAIDSPGAGRAVGRSGEGRSDDSADEAEFESLADRFDAVAPQTDIHRALVGAYWLASQGQVDFQAQPFNTALKNLGHARHYRAAQRSIGDE